MIRWLSHTPSATNKPNYFVRYVSFYANRTIDQYVSQLPTRVSLRQLIQFGRGMTDAKLQVSANFVLREMIVRISRRIREMQNFPFIVTRNPHIARVLEIYWHGFSALRKISRIQSLEDNRRFCAILPSLLDDHAASLLGLAEGMLECTKHLREEQIHKFMDSMLKARIGRRLLILQHMRLTEEIEQNRRPEDGYVGVVYTKCHAGDIIRTCAQRAAVACKACTTESTAKSRQTPTVEISGDVNATFTYVPGHLSFIFSRLLRNSMLSVLDGAVTQDSAIRVVVSQGESDITFRISDLGGRNLTARASMQGEGVWYENLARGSKVDLGLFESDTALPFDISPDVQYYQHGVDLALARAYANYFGGALSYYTIAGHGTDVYVRIDRSGSSLEKVI